MKKVRTTIMALALVGGAFAAMSMAPAKTKTKSGDAMRHWFDSNTGNYLGQRLESQQQALCGDIFVEPCADGYSSITGSPGSEQPVGAKQFTALKEAE